jgi:exodeoxyribonuclease-5
MTWSPEQDAALKAVAAWWRSSDRSPVFRLFGYAGTGKTTLARHFAECVEGRVVFPAPTGKAAYRLRECGCPNASTIHRRIYKTRWGPVPQFELLDNPLEGIALAILDEASMVSAEVGEDLVSCGVPVLALGDLYQLPPVYGRSYFLGVPDVFLHEVKRQALSNPIIAMATDVRLGKRLQLGTYGDSAVVSVDSCSPDGALHANTTVLVGLNRTRQSLNTRARKLRGFDGIFPAADDRLVCLRNRHHVGLLNGSLWSVRACPPVSASEDDFQMRVTSEDDDETIDVATRTECFKGGLDDVNWRDRMDCAEFDYAYALTVHKAQGSQWREIVLFDQSSRWGPDANKWLYTGISRAAERITVVVP